MINRDRLVERAAEALYGERVVYMPNELRVVTIAMPVFVKAVTDEVRLLHARVGKAFSFSSSTNEAPLLRYHCAACGDWYDYPCPTVRLLDEIDATLGVTQPEGES